MAILKPPPMWREPDIKTTRNPGRPDKTKKTRCSSTLQTPRKMCLTLKTTGWIWHNELLLQAQRYLFTYFDFPLFWGHFTGYPLWWCEGGDVLKIIFFYLMYLFLGDRQLRIKMSKYKYVACLFMGLSDQGIHFWDLISNWAAGRCLLVKRPQDNAENVNILK